jgi:hypothetical protein
MCSQKAARAQAGVPSSKGRHIICWSCGAGAYVEKATIRAKDSPTLRRALLHTGWSPT